MHELAIAQGLIDAIASAARRHGARRATRAVARIGPLSGVEPAQLAQAFSVARAGTCADGAELEIETPPVTVACSRCGAEGAAAANRLLCPACGDWRVRLTGGDEMILTSVELADFDPIQERSAPCATPAAAP